MAGYWKFDDGTGTSAVDSSGNGHTGTLYNGVSWIAGKMGDAVSAQAASRQYVKLPAINLAATKAVTVTLWANRTYSTAGGHTLFEATTNYNSSTTGFALFPDDDTCGGIQAALHGNVGYVANCYNQPSSGVWHFLAVVFDKTQSGGNEVALYVDGVLQPVISNVLASTNTNYFGNNPVYLFSRGGGSEFNSGDMDDLRIYNSALTAAQIQQIYNGATLSSITVTPTNSTIGVGDQEQFTATGNYSDGSHQNLTNSVTWTSSATSIATISSTGLASGVAQGTTAIQATSGTINGSTGLTVTAGSGSFTLSASPTSLTIAPNNQGTSTITTTISGSFDNSVSLSASGAPNGTTVSFNPATIAAPGAGTSTMTITVGASTTPGNYPITVTGIGGTIQQQATVTLTVPGAPNFSISASPASLNITQGNQGNSTITTAVSGGFNSSITLSATGVPGGTTVSFNPSTIGAPGAGSSAMTINVGSGTPTGTYPITVTGNGGGIQQNVTVTLGVVSQGSNRSDTCTTAPNTNVGNGWTMKQCRGASSNPPPNYPTSLTDTLPNGVQVGDYLIAAIQEAGGVGEYLYATDSLGNVAAGTVNTSGTTVTFAGGLPFSLSGCSSISGSRCYWNGKTIVINGSNYTIASVNSISSITLTTSAGNQTGVPYKGPGWWCSDTDGDVESSVQSVCVAYVSTAGLDTITGTCSPGAYHCGGSDQYVFILNVTEIANSSGIASLDYAACPRTGCAVTGGAGTGWVETSGSNPYQASLTVTPGSSGELIYWEAGYGVGPVWPPSNWYGLINGVQGANSSDQYCQGDSSTGYCSNEAQTQLLTLSVPGAYRATQNDGTNGDFYVAQVLAFTHR